MRLPQSTLGAYSLPSTVLLATAILTGSVAQAQQFDDILRGSVPTRVQRGSADEEVLGLARAAHLNFVTDATAFPDTVPDSPSLAEEKFQTLHQLLVRLAIRHNLTWERTAPRTFVFWSQPDIMGTAQLIGINEKLPLADEVVDQATMGKLLRDHLPRVRDWRRVGDQWQVAVRDLPLPLRSKVVARVQWEQTTDPITPYQKKRLSNDYWRDTVLVSKEEWNGSKKLHVKFQDGVTTAVAHLRPPDPRLVDERGATRPQALLRRRQQLLNRTPQQALADALRRNPQLRTQLQRRSLQATRPAANANPPANTAAVIPSQPSVPARLQERMPSQPPPIIPGDPLAVDLHSQAALDVTVSLEAKHWPVVQIIEELQRQSGIGLAVEASASKGRAVTLRIEKMPLREVMQSLARLFGWKWARDDTGYKAGDDGHGELAHTLLQFGDMRWLWQRFTRSGTRVSFYELPEIQPHLDMLAIDTPEGMPFDELPVEVQDAMRTRSQWVMAMLLIEKFQNGTAAGIEAAPLVFMPEKPIPNAPKDLAKGVPPKTPARAYVRVGGRYINLAFFDTPLEFVLPVNTIPPASDATPQRP